MADTTPISKITITNEDKSISTRDIGANAENIMVGQDSERYIEAEGSADKTTLVAALNAIKNNATQRATINDYGQIKLGNGLKIDDDGTTSVDTSKFLTATATVGEAKKVSNSLNFKNGTTTTATYNGEKAVEINCNTIGAAPNRNATTSQSGIVKLIDDYKSDAKDLAPTANALYQAYNALKPCYVTRSVGTENNKGFYENCINVSSRDYQAIGGLTIPSAGVWLMEVSARFPGNSSGMRSLCINNEEVWHPQSGVQIYATGTGAIWLHTTRILNIRDSKTLYPILWQNSGTTLACATRATAVKISPEFMEAS